MKFGIKLSGKIDTRIFDVEGIVVSGHEPHEIVLSSPTFATREAAQRRIDRNRNRVIAAEVVELTA